MVTYYYLTTIFSVGRVFGSKFLITRHFCSVRDFLHFALGHRGLFVWHLRFFFFFLAYVRYISIIYFCD